MSIEMIVFDQNGENEVSRTSDFLTQIGKMQAWLTLPQEITIEKNNGDLVDFHFSNRGEFARTIEYLQKRIAVTPTEVKLAE